MAQFIVILTTIILVGFLITAVFAIKEIRENKNVKIKVLIDGKHVVYTFKPQTYEFEGFEVVPKYKVSLEDNHLLEDYPTMTPIDPVVLKSRVEQSKKSIEQNFAFEVEYA